MDRFCPVKCIETVLRIVRFGRDGDATDKGNIYLFQTVHHGVQRSNLTDIVADGKQQATS